MSMTRTKEERSFEAKMSRLGRCAGRAKKEEEKDPPRTVFFSLISGACSLKYQDLSQNGSANKAENTGDTPLSDADGRGAAGGGGGTVIERGRKSQSRLKYVCRALFAYADDDDDLDLEEPVLLAGELGGGVLDPVGELGGGEAGGGGPWEAEGPAVRDPD
jgi:hypothetical protein